MGVGRLDEGCVLPLSLVSKLNDGALIQQISPPSEPPYTYIYFKGSDAEILLHLS